MSFRLSGLIKAVPSCISQMTAFECPVEVVFFIFAI
ncbi:hypothetical protein BAAM0499_07610 [Bifidobacterium animalis subsp. animalis MCC 0499]|nr:hypothetical protein BAAM0499_07610 [Bifidobacterium animalis subsp. animalis MCC 0499]